VLSHSGIFSVAQRLPTRVILPNQSFAVARAVQRNLTTTSSDHNSDSTANSQYVPTSKAKPKSTRKKTGASTETARKDKKGGNKKADTKRKVTVHFKDLPPRPPGPAYIQWLRGWLLAQPKMENLEVAQNAVKKGAQVWKTLPEDDKERYREKAHALADEYRGRIEEWREKVDPAVLRELNRRRVAKGRKRIRGSRRPLNGYFRFCQRVRDEYPRTDGDYKTYFKALTERASSQWRAMSDLEKAEFNDPAKADYAAWLEKRRTSELSQGVAG